MPIDETELLPPNVTTGVLDFPQKIRDRDWVAGEVSGIKYESRVPSGDWTMYLPDDEWQTGVYFDTFGCVSFSALNSLETQLRWMLFNNKLTASQIGTLRSLGILDVNNVPNLSDRFTAKMSGTTSQGNYLMAVADSIRNDGVIAESHWNYPRLQRTPPFVWEDYYQEIPQELKNLGKEWRKIFTVRAEWIETTRASIVKHIKQAPLQIAAKVCDGWNNAPVVPSCGVGNGHATILYHVQEDADTTYKDFDHYQPFRKQLAADYGISSVLKLVLLINEPDTNMSPEAQAYLNTHQGKMILGTPSGRMALVKGNEIQEVPKLPDDATPADRAAHRTALMSLMRQVIEDNGGVTDELYSQFPSRPF